MQKPLIAFAAFNALLGASLFVSWLIVDWRLWEGGFSLMAAMIFLLVEAVIVASTIGPALMQGEGRDDV